MTRDVITAVCCLLSGATLAVLLYAVKSFGAYTERCERASTLCRQSNELTRQSNERRIDWEKIGISEGRANATINAQTAEKTLEVFTDTMRLRGELLDIINNQKRSA